MTNSTLDIPLGNVPHGERGTDTQELLIRFADEHHGDRRSPACDSETTLRDWWEAMPELRATIEAHIA